LLALEAVSVGQADFALRASWSIGAGERVAVIGPSGAGKSTLLMAISGFLPLESGRILWKGCDLGALGPGARPVSILFQDQNLFPHLNVERNLALGLSTRSRLSAAQTARIAAVLERVGLPEMAARRPAELSGGQLARVALARALLRARPILLLDEPFSALGPALRAEMLALVNEVADETGALVLMVTHDPQDARAMRQTVLVAEGHAYAPAATVGLFAAPPPALRDYLGG
jgi:thiamine transport system ATP-binding protein